MPSEKVMESLKNKTAMLLPCESPFDWDKDGNWYNVVYYEEKEKGF